MSCSYKKFKIIAMLAMVEDWVSRSKGVGMDLQTCFSLWMVARLLGNADLRVGNTLSSLSSTNEPLRNEIYYVSEGTREWSLFISDMPQCQDSARSQSLATRMAGFLSFLTILKIVRLLTEFQYWMWFWL